MRLVIFNLLDDPFPPESEAYLDSETGEKLPYVRLLDIPTDTPTVIRLYYTVDGEHLAIQLLEIR